ncbi:VOC family protein [Stutzerimonas stutzeri]|uniref:VOC family protein n=1 Tax=Stutzerimonas stutzeri TaxID=316 RepID=A0A2N8SMJ9_STUST|nr:VOC family protein [Stutzerimonas stutzeri]EQM73934.1 3-demethylubiquinone-9 3-methyltransferase [Stutzerimonas stutzeri MF28]MCQ4250800.1 VOC family protein [Stutzerimonas stutzeri]PNG03710.1 VOC family protein [Stutzerimonas stutzeri]PNG15824.1 VOC family protein [Stutzerimonas stutzeri]QUE77111.1 VOC family protein [Stutzerimonas stutzeri]
MKITPYLTFDGQARDAFTLYQKVLGGTLEMMTFAQAPESEHFPAEHRERIMHVCLNLGDYQLMASDTMPGDAACGGGPYEGIKGCSISLHPKSVAEGERVFNGLAEGGQVVMPLEKTFWAERFGMFVDRFGVSWMVNCEHDAPV